MAFEGKEPLRINYKQKISEVIDVLAKWRWMSGVNNTQSEEEIGHELAIIAKFVLDNYENITVDEISLAIDLSLTDKLDADVRTFNTFTPMYVSRILNAYIEYRRRMYNELMLRNEIEKNKIENQKSTKPSPEEELQTTRELISDFYRKYKETGEVEDFFNILYNYLRKTKKINPSKQVIDEAMLYGKRKAKEHIKTYFEDAIGRTNMEESQIEIVEKRYARNYCVQKFFDTLDLEDFLSKMQISEFQ